MRTETGERKVSRGGGNKKDNKGDRSDCKETYLSSGEGVKGKAILQRERKTNLRGRVTFINKTYILLEKKRRTSAK